MILKFSQTDIQILVNLQFFWTNDIICLLFFSCLNDYVNKILKSNLTIDSKYFSECFMLRLTEHVTWKKETFNTWYSEFLMYLSDIQYVHVFHKVMKIQNSIFKWEKFVWLTIKIFKSMKKILQHVLYWYQSSWKYSEHASNLLKIFNWIKIILFLFFSSKKSIIQEAFFEQILTLV